MKLNRIYLCVTAIALGMWASIGHAQLIAISPAEFANVEMPGVANVEGFPSYRLQQVYSASDFAHLGSGPFSITRVDWRPDGGVTEPMTYFSPNWVVKLSTTSKEPGSLSPTFADNIGLDETTVFTGPYTLTTDNLGPAGGPKVFDYGVDFGTSFEYDPNKGNLLMDLAIVDGVGPLLGDLTLEPTATTSFQWTGTLGYESPVAATTLEQVGGQWGGHAARFTIVPEPSTASLLLTASIVWGLLLGSRRRRSFRRVSWHEPPPSCLTAGRRPRSRTGDDNGRPNAVRCNNQVVNQRWTRRKRLLEPLELRYCLSATVFAESHTIHSCFAEVGESCPTAVVHTADLDGDGDLDVLSSPFVGANIAWYENTDGKGDFRDKQIIATIFGLASDVHAADLDGDGDMDILSAFSDGGNDVAWYENTDGHGTFERRSQFTIEYVESVHAADLDRDGDMDVLLTLYDAIAWYDNLDGQGHFGDRRIIARERNYATSVHAADLDGDGDMDVLSTSGNDGGIVWYENNGEGGFGDRRIIAQMDNAFEVHAADLDSDGDIDVLSASLGRIAWSENTDGSGTFGEQQTIASRDGGLSWNVAIGDLDGDNDLDVVSSSLHDDTVAWYENTDGQGNFGEQQIIAQVNGAGYVSVGDFDSDGDVDVLSGSMYFLGDEGAKAGKIIWFENHLLGDSNNDGVFDSSDLVAVFQAGKYEDGIDDSATFDEGDWNLDGKFDSADLVAAFQQGHYVS